MWKTSKKTIKALMSIYRMLLYLYMMNVQVGKGTVMFVVGILITVAAVSVWFDLSYHIHTGTNYIDKNDSVAIDRVNKAISLVSLVGREEAFEILSSNFAIYEDWYVFVYDKETGLEVVNPWTISPGDVRDWKDLDGRSAGVKIYNASTKGEFVEYSFTAPVSGKDIKRYKRSFVKSSEGYIYGAGYYQDRKRGEIDESWDLDRDGINDCESDGSCDHTIDYSKPAKIDTIDY